MAQTHKDIYLRQRIESLAKQIKGTDREIIYQISAICGISFETAKRHYNLIKAQRTLIDSGFVENCSHVWSFPFTTPSGLVKECMLCHETREVHVQE